MEKYEEMLEQGIKNLPARSIQKERFEVPKVQGHIEGNKTIVTNFFQIAAQLRRNPDHLLKFLQREMATPGIIKDDRLILGRKIGSAQINEKIERYSKIFVICKECGKPDTQLIKEGGVLMIKCMVCGARHPAR